MYVFLAFLDVCTFVCVCVNACRQVSLNLVQTQSGIKASVGILRQAMAYKSVAIPKLEDFSC